MSERGVSVQLLNLRQASSTLTVASYISQAHTVKVSDCDTTNRIFLSDS